jgi:hypothetical protein
MPYKAMTSPWYTGKVELPHGAEPMALVKRQIVLPGV